MKNVYLKDLNKIEFVVTYACTGRCKHCSEGDHESCGDSIDADMAADTVKKISDRYEIKTVMAFGGEPLLCPNAVCAIMNAAKEKDIPRRQVITNGYFSKSDEKIREVVQRLFECGVNDLLLSVDAFHQETIPLEAVKRFASEVKGKGIPIRLQPAWLVSESDDNSYNQKTRNILGSFCEMDISVNDGNVIFPEGNARKYLADYFKDGYPKNPYEEDPFDVKCLSISPNGDVLDGNIYQRDIVEIIKDYAP